MESRHEALLTTLLERVRDIGYQKLMWGDVYRWYDVKRVAAGTLRDIDRRWNEITRGECGRLLQLEIDGGVILFPEKDSDKKKNGRPFNEE